MYYTVKTNPTGSGMAIRGIARTLGTLLVIAVFPVLIVQAQFLDMNPYETDSVNVSPPSLFVSGMLTQYQHQQPRITVDTRLLRLQIPVLRSSSLGVCLFGSASIPNLYFDASEAGTERLAYNTGGVSVSALPFVHLTYSSVLEGYLYAKFSHEYWLASTDTFQVGLNAVRVGVPGFCLIADISEFLGKSASDTSHRSLKLQLDVSIEELQPINNRQFEKFFSSENANRQRYRRVRIGVHWGQIALWVEQFNNSTFDQLLTGITVRLF